MALPLFRLPILVIKLILETMGFIEIFVLANTSLKTKRIYRNLVTIRNYQMLLFLEKKHIVFDFRTESDPSLSAPIYLRPKKFARDSNDFLLQIESSERVRSNIFYKRDDDIAVLIIYRDTSISTGAKLYNALFEVFRMPLHKISMNLDNVPFETYKSWIDANNDLFSDISRLIIIGKCSFSNYNWILKKVITRHALYFEVKPTENPNNPEPIDFVNIGAADILVNHGRWINVEQLNLIRADDVDIWRSSLTDNQINAVLRNWRDSEVASTWKKLEIHFEREAEPNIVLEGIEAIDENLMKPYYAINQWSFEMANGEKCTVIYGFYTDDENNEQYGFEFHIRN